MTPEQFNREKAYHVALSIAKSMLKSGMITEQEYKQIDFIILEKYRPVQGVLSC